MKTIIFARVSDKGQDSNAAQVSRVLDYVKSRGLSLWKTYEIEESSTKGERARFQQVLTDIRKAREPIALVVDTVDRLQRSFRESVILDDLRKEGRLEIHFYRESLVIHQKSNSAELLRWDVAVMFARSYVLQLSDNVKRKLDEMRKSGKWTSRAPLGYLSILNSEGKRTDIVVDPKTAPLIVRTFSLYATGNYSLYTLTLKMSRLGLRCKTGRKLTVSEVDRFLKNPFYYGEMLAGGQLYPHEYQPLISRKLFDQCRQVREGWHKKPFAYAAKEFPFRGLLRCKTCACSMSPLMAKGKYTYYSCTNARKDICSKKIYVPEKDLLSPIQDYLNSFRAIPQQAIDDIVEGLRRSEEEALAFDQKAADALRQEDHDIRARIDRLVDWFLDDEAGSIRKEDYERKLKQLKARQAEISIQLEGNRNPESPRSITASTVFSLAQNAWMLFESFSPGKKRVFLNYLLQNSVVEGKIPLYSLRSPYAEMVALVNHPSRGGERDAFRTLDWRRIREELELIRELSLELDADEPPLAA